MDSLWTTHWMDQQPNDQKSQKKRKTFDNLLTGKMFLQQNLIFPLVLIKRENFNWIKLSHIINKGVGGLVWTWVWSGRFLLHWLRVNGFIANGQEDLCSFVLHTLFVEEHNFVTSTAEYNLKLMRGNGNLFWKIKFLLLTLMSESTKQTMLIKIIKKSHKICEIH